MTDNEVLHTLVVTNLCIGYKNKKHDIPVAKGIDFKLATGELTAIVGVNGIGKSTLLRTLCAVQPKLSGGISLKGKPISYYSKNVLATYISIVLTEAIASKNMTVFELVALGRQPYTNWLGTLTTLDLTKVDEALQMLELNDLKNKKCHELSDGQLQRVLIGRALAQDTSMIMLDEPTTHLDLYHKVQILKLLKHIAHRTKKTIVFTSHEIELAIQLCDKMLLLDGRTNPFGQPCELIEQKAFENLFPKDAVSFDAITGSFRVEK
ncbi:MAG: ABC transporter ATP-binding protein [Flavobacteriaceae bacterium]